jgi:hypothetical protein
MKKTVTLAAIIMLYALASLAVASAYSYGPSYSSYHNKPYYNSYAYYSYNYHPYYNYHYRSYYPRYHLNAPYGFGRAPYRHYPY